MELYRVTLRPSGDFCYADFESYFCARSGYTVGHDQAWYTHTDTGVYFYFDYHLAQEPAGDVVTFDLHLGQPSYFAREAVIELEALIQSCGMRGKCLDAHGASVAYQSETFLKGYDRANREFCKKKRAGEQDQNQNAEMLLSQQQQILDWQWNYGRGDLQQTLGSEMVVPQISLFGLKQRVLRGIAWLDAGGIMVPRVDVILLNRRRLAPRKFLLKIPDMALVNYEEIEPLLVKYGVASGGGAYQLSYEIPPQEIQAFFRSRTRHRRSLDILLSNDRVLDREIYNAND